MKLFEKMFLFFKAIFLIKNIGNYILDYLGKIHEEYTLELRDGISIKLRGGTTDRMIFNDIFLRKEYSRHLKETPSFVVDVGAHIGLFALFFAKKSKKILCFEPEKNNFRLLRENIKLNNFKNILAYNCGIYSKNGKMKLYFPKGKNYDSFSLFKNGKDYEIINVITPEIIFRNFEVIDFMKVDCEGCEKEIISLLDFKRINNLCVEFHGIESKKKILNILNKEYEHIKVKNYGKDLGLIWAWK